MITIKLYNIPVLKNLFISFNCVMMWNWYETNIRIWPHLRQPNVTRFDLDKLATQIVTAWYIYPDLGDLTTT